MSQNILITGAAGYVGGSVLAEILSRASGPFEKANITAAVRSNEQVQALSKFNINVAQLDLSDESALHEAVASNKIDIIIHTASGYDAKIISNLIKALGQRRKVSGGKTYFIHSSVSTVFAAEAGWPYGEVKDSDPTILEKDKQIGGAHVVRQTNILVTELGKEQGVVTFNLAIPNVYGRGTGEWRKLSVSIPAYTRAAIKSKSVYKFDKDAYPPHVHITDLATLYALVLEKILLNEPLPSDENGHYFAFAHRGHWWAILDGLAKSLHARGLVDHPKAQIFSSDEMAAEHLHFPVQYIRAIGTASPAIVAVNPYQIGWQPKWDEKSLLESIDDEVQAVLELDTVKQTVFDDLMDSSK